MGVEPFDFGKFIDQGEQDRRLGRLRYDQQGRPYTVPTYSELEPQRQAYAAASEARSEEALGQRMKQMNAVDAQQGRALRYADAGMPRPGTFEAPTDFRTPVKVPPPALKLSLPQGASIPVAAGKLAGVGGKLASLASPIGDALALAEIAGNVGSAVLNAPGMIKGLAEDGAVAGRDLGKFLDARRDRLQQHPEQRTPFDELLQHLPFVPRQKRSSNLPDYLEPRGQRIPVGTFPAGTVFVVTFASPGRTDVFRVRDLTEASAHREGAGTGFGAYIYVLKGSDTNFEARIFNDNQPSVSTAIEPSGGGASQPVPTPTGQAAAGAGDAPSIPSSPLVGFDPSPAPAPKPKPRSTPKPDQTPQLAAQPQPAPRREPSRAPTPSLSPAAQPQSAPALQPQPAPALQPQSTPGQSPSPDSAGGTLRAPSLNPDRFPDSQIGNQNEPLRAPSLNPDKFPDPAPSKQPDPRSPESPNKEPSPTIDPTPQPKPEPEPQPQPQPQRQCTDPCIAEMQAQQEKNKPVEIKVKIFKACKTPASGNSTTPAASTGEDDDKATYEEKTIKVPAQEADTYKLLYSRIAKLEALQCESSKAIASVPEWWQLRAEAQRPQLVVIFSEVFASGKLGKSRWSLTIPHYNKPKGFKPQIPAYEKGNFQGVLTLTDNSKLIVNAKSLTECKRVLNSLKLLVPASYRTRDGKGIKPKVGELPDAGFKICRVTPSRADFYKTGARNLTPDWSIDFKPKA